MSAATYITVPLPVVERCSSSFIVHADGSRGVML